MFILEETILICPCLQSHKGLVVNVNYQEPNEKVKFSKNHNESLSIHSCVAQIKLLHPWLLESQLDRVCYHVHNFVTMSRRDV